ncbi:hypothetical protein F5884DRAFT_173172 [Xylogone sp. PMI_703]|nr:hypothetical protein F5884DRAFT_173172 [Xylogone sp. PMI_703]
MLNRSAGHSRRPARAFSIMLPSAAPKTAPKTTRVPAQPASFPQILSQRTNAQHLHLIRLFCAASICFFFPQCSLQSLCMEDASLLEHGLENAKTEGAVVVTIDQSQPFVRPRPKAASPLAQNNCATLLLTNPPTALGSLLPSAKRSEHSQRWRAM